MLVAETTTNGLARLIVEVRQPGGVALRTASGGLLVPQDGGGGEVLVGEASPGGLEILQPIHLGQNRVAFRTINGHFLTLEHEPGGRLLANARRMQESELWSVLPA